MYLVIYLILIAFILVKFLDFYLDSLNLQNLKLYGKNVPKGFEDVIDKEKLIKISEYTIEKSKFEFYSKLFSCAVMVIFFFTPLINFYNHIIFSFSLPYVWNGIVYFLILVYIYTFITIPFDLHSTFKIEKKYGFNTMTAKLWIVDFIKSLIVSTVIFGVLIAVSFTIIKYVHFWWFWVWIVFLAFTIGMMYLSPYVLEPLFNKFSPVESNELTAKLASMMAVVGIKVSKVLKMDASKRTKHTNAYFSGIGHVKRIVLFDTLLEKMNDDEIVSVIAHEAGHWKKKHIIKRIITVEILSLIILYIAYLLISGGYLLTAFNIAGVGTLPQSMLLPCSFILIYFIANIVMFPFMPLMNRSSRKHEREADMFASKLCKGSSSMISALKKLSADNLSNLHPHSLYSLFHYSHPPVVERVAYLKTFKN